jgi:hypothetical protein
MLCTLNNRGRECENVSQVVDSLNVGTVAELQSFFDFDGDDIVSKVGKLIYTSLNG